MRFRAFFVAPVFSPCQPPRIADPVGLKSIQLLIEDKHGLQTRAMILRLRSPRPHDNLMNRRNHRRDWGKRLICSAESIELERIDN